MACIFDPRDTTTNEGQRTRDELSSVSEERSCPWSFLYNVEIWHERCPPPLSWLRDEYALCVGSSTTVSITSTENTESTAATAVDTNTGSYDDLGYI
jgi:hypothetical protein